MKRKSLRRMNYLGLFTLSFLAAIAVCSDAPAITLSVSGAAGRVGAELVSPVVVKDPQGLGALQMELTYDPAVVELKSIEAGPGVAGLFDWNIVQPGTARIAMALNQAVSAEGDLFVAKFKALGEGKSPLRLLNVRAWDQANSMDLIVSVEPGVLTVKTGFGVNMILIGFFIALAAVVLIVLLVRRSKK